MFNLALFGDINIDEKLREIKKATLSTDYIRYYLEFKKQSEYYDNYYLKQCITIYLTNIDVSKRSEIVEIITENIDMGYAAFLIASMKDSNPKTIQIDIDFEKVLSEYMKPENETPYFLTLFFMQHFLNFDHIDIDKYNSYQLNRDQYFALLSDYLRPQKKLY
ncbi:hypothetical protein [Sphingobacterium suaedae]|uniref:Uncharacterized protein n=1 Tax=Sphingobacterium suaedae TaxID=1686402 RepID=A0ABW5KFU5_9SPHI